MALLVNILGWIGSIILVLAYYLNSRDVINAQSVSYQGMNILASVLLIVNTVYYGAYPSSAVNVVWIFIGFNFLIKAKNKTENSEESKSKTIDD